LSQVVPPERRAQPGVGDTALMMSWLVIVALAVGIAAISGVFVREIRAAIEVWNASTAYSHCYLVLPMALYLLWERRELLARVRAAPDVRFALAAIPLTLLWLVAERLGIMEVRQLSVIAGVELLFLTVLGHQLFRRISGPLLFLFFLVPFGAFLTPALQQFTATFTILGLNLLGIPNFSDKFTIETPAGIFFVAEACAGLRFLIAAFAFGVFYSLLSYTSVMRRVVFIAASIVVPVIANGFRALGIVVLGQVLGSAEAAAADHLIYGWVFFSAVMLMLIAGGHVFRDAEPDWKLHSKPAGTISSRSPVWCVVAVVMLLGFGPALGGVIDATLVVPTLPEMDAIVAPSGCSLSNRPGGSSAQQRLSVVVCGGEHFDVSVTAFAARSTSSAMIVERRRVTQEIGAENSAVSVLDLPSSAGHWTVVQTTDPNRVTAYASWVDGAPVVSGMAGRVAQAHDSIFGADFVPALITITTAEPANSPPGQRRATLERLTTLLHEQSTLNAKMQALTRLSGN
jgi:exosortase A